MKVIREGKEIKQKHLQMIKVIRALETGNFANFTQEDIELAAEIIAENVMSEEDMEPVEELVKEQMILELAGVEKVFKDEE